MMKVWIDRAKAALRWIAMMVVVSATPGVLEGQEAPPFPTDLPVWLVGSPNIEGGALTPYEDVRFSLGQTGKEGPLAFGAKVDEAAYQLMSLRADREDGRDVWMRSVRTYVAANGDEPVAEAMIVLDRATLRPLRSAVTRQGSTTSFEYDWVAYLVKQDVDGDDSSVPTPLDLDVLEAGAHETWIGAIDWTEDTRAMIPTILAGGGGKWWAVPRVVGVEAIDIGDGESRSAWVVELDWWGMGPDRSTFTPGGGANGSAGQGGKYWVLQDPSPGLPRVVRIQTEAAETVDRVNQLQNGVGHD